MPLESRSAHRFQYDAENHDEFTRNRNLDKVHELNPALQSFPTWLNNHLEQLEATQS